MFASVLDLSWADSCWLSTLTLAMAFVVLVVFGCIRDSHGRNGH